MIPPQGAMTTSVASPSSSKRAGLGKLMLGIFVGLSLAAFFYFDLGQYLSLDGLKSNRARLLAFTEANYPVAVAMFVLGYCVVVGLSLPGGAIMTLAGDFSSAACWARSTSMSVRPWVRRWRFWWLAICSGNGWSRNSAIDWMAFSRDLPVTRSVIC